MRKATDGHPRVHADLPAAGRAMKNGDTRHSTQMIGRQQSYQDVLNHWVDHGRFFSPARRGGRRSGSASSVRSRATSSAIGSDRSARTIRIEGNNFTVVGVIEEAADQPRQQS